jgi:two-component system response regulator FixJ
MDAKFAMNTKADMNNVVLPAESSVYIVEDDTAVSDSVAQLLRMQGYRTVSFTSAEAFLDAVHPGCGGCAIVDIRLPGADGLILQSTLQKRGINLSVIIVTGHGDTQNSRAAFKAGAVDFLEKPIDADALLEAVATAMNAGELRQRGEAERVSLAGKLARLTARENEVLELILQGKHSREVAETLKISPRTVEVYKSRLMEKLQVTRTNDLLRLVIAYRLSGGGKSAAS